MRIIRNCNTCEFNFNQICAGHGDILSYGDAIPEELDNNVICTGWGVSFEYYDSLIEKVPWYIQKNYSYMDQSIDYDEFIRRIDADEKGLGIDVNLYDAIEHVYGLKIFELAEILDVSIGVIMYARRRGTVSKRVIEFSPKLCIPPKFFGKFLSTDLSELEQCCKVFYGVKQIQDVPHK